MGETGWIDNEGPILYCVIIKRIFLKYVRPVKKHRQSLEREWFFCVWTQYFFTWSIHVFETVQRRMSNKVDNMRSEAEIKNIVIAFAETNDKISAVILNGSRTKPNINPDKFQDFDLALVGIFGRFARVIGNGLNFNYNFQEEQNVTLYLNECYANRNAER